MRVLLVSFCFVFIACVVGCADAQQKRDEYYARAQKSFAAGEFAEAKVDLRNVLKIDSQFAPAYNLLGRTYFQLKAYKRAFSYLNKAVELNPEDNEAQLWLGRLYYMAGREDEAIRYGEMCLKSDPHDGDALLLIGASLLKSGQGERAAERLATLLDDAEHAEEASLLLSDYYLKKEDMDAAQALLSRTLRLIPQSDKITLRLAEIFMKVGNIEKAEVLLKDLVARHQENIKLHIVLSNFYKKLGQFQQAEAVLTALPREQQGTVEVVTERAKIALAEKNSEKAEAILNHGIQTVDDDISLRIMLAALYARMGRMDNVKTVYLDASKAYEGTPNEAKLRILFAEELLKNNQAGEAKEQLALVLKGNPGDLNAHVLLGRIALDEGNLDEAISSFRIVVSEDPSNADAATYLAQAHFMNDEPRIAEDILLQLLKKKPNFEPARLTLLRHYIRNNQLNQALLQAQELVKEDSKKTIYRLMLGEIYERQGDLDKAEECYQFVLDQPSGIPLGASRIGRIRLKKKDYQGADAMFDKALAASPVFALALTGKLAVFSEQNNIPAAVDFIDNAIQNYPDAAILYELRGMLAQNNGNIEAAKNYYWEAIKHDPNKRMPYLSLVNLAMRVGGPEQAIAWLQAGRTNALDTPQLRYMLANLHLKLNEIDKAKTELSSLIKSDPDFLPAANDLAYLISETSQDSKDLEYAATLARKAAVHGDANTLDTLGWIYFLQGRHEIALETLEKAYDSRDSDANAAFHLASVLQAMGKVEKAKRIVNDVLKSTDTPKDPALLEKIQVLSNELAKNQS
ncbi:tetratricopeptide repeat protein [Desulfovibrio inopinatus]|uniref:tetratricopeptide repeat protein n=1 Tax=Desulfovibrio inopinatus TaxID=102109 RepID=UPI000400C667|nr:tetratricopeptide repeat protein [Desulfovibrio inopinatus]